MAAFIRSVACPYLTLECSSILKIKEKRVIDLKRYVRALRRRPVKILYPEDDIEKSPKQTRVAELQTESLRFTAKKNGAGNRSKTNSEAEINPFLSTFKNSTEHSEMKRDSLKWFDELDGLRYEKAYPGDKRLAKVVSVARFRKYREQQGKVLLEGRRLISDALEAGAVPQTLFFSAVDRLRELPLDRLRRASLVKVKFEDIRIWSDLVTPQGVIAIFSRPDTSQLAFPEDRHANTVPLSLVCDNVRDPGNLGTILRSAAAAGCQSVLLTKGCVDVWEPKVLRAAMGAHFRLPIIPNLGWDSIPKHLPDAVTVHLADHCGARTEDGVVENGAQGHFPRKAGDFGWVRSRPSPRTARYEEHSGDWQSDSDQSSDDDDEDKGKRPEFALPVVEPQLYHESWPKSHTVLVIGGETHGLSLEALRLAEETDGRRLFIPMVPGVDSLNSAMAASILLFEGRRQLALMTRLKSDSRPKSKML